MNMPPAEARPVRVLLVEDNEDDVFLTRKAFEAARFLVDINHVDNGEKCLKFLRRQPPYQDAPTADIILLDLNMPVMDGRAVLEEIVADSALRHLPVVILTTSAADADVLQMYQLRCSSYIVKPVGFDDFTKVVKKLGNFWFKLVILPTEAAAQT
jgi:CheY-like chemotaxis protein